MKTLTLTIILMTTAIIGLGQNLISNSSFENSGQLSCQSWYESCGQELIYLCDTITPDTLCFAEFYQDAPTGGGTWSLYLSSGMFPPGSKAQTYISGLSNTYVYELKVWMKTYDLASGFIATGMLSQNQFIKSKEISDISSTWNQYVIIDTLTTNLSDTIAVQLSSSVGPIDFGYAYFDLIELTILDTLTAIEDIDQFDSDLIKIYPNPSKETTTIEIMGSNNENRRLTVYNSTGQIIKTIQTANNILTIDNRSIASGLYYYQIQKATDKKTIGQGKFIVE
ncbi:T9SS type A sorting domain-containing protein [bacterium AH-315-M05]|nr:T9SS type A sorting domain-containing protein [bacterium AH-315-M05]